MTLYKFQVHNIINNICIYNIMFTTTSLVSIHQHTVDLPQILHPHVTQGASNQMSFATVK